MADLWYSVSIHICPCTVDTFNCVMCQSVIHLLQLFITEPPVSTWYFFLQNGCVCGLKDIVDVKQFLDKIRTSFIRLGIQISYHASFVKFC